MSPIEQILLETDAPFLTPVPYRGRENAPCYLPFVAEKIAEVKKLPLQQVIEQTYHNSLRTFFPAG
jgi:TatD DNase family protein